MKPEKKCSSNDRIRELLDYYKINQTEFCKKTGINKSALSNYLSGNRLPRQDQLYKIADAFGINAAWLMGFDVPMTYDRDVLHVHYEDNQKPHLEFWGAPDRIALYSLMLENADGCKPEDLKVIIETLKALKAKQETNADYWINLDNKGDV